MLVVLSFTAQYSTSFAQYIHYLHMCKPSQPYLCNILFKQPTCTHRTHRTSSLVTTKNLNIFSPATTSSASRLFVSATVSKQYTTAGLATVLWTFPFTLACALFFTSLPTVKTVLWMVDPRYSNSSTFSSSLSPSHQTLAFCRASTNSLEHTSTSPRSLPPLP